MFHVIEYTNEKRYIWDTNTERQWRVAGLREKEKVGERGKKVADVEKKGKEEEEIQTGHHGPVRDPQI